jgi:hypothetical protein
MSLAGKCFIVLWASLVIVGIPLALIFNLYFGKINVSSEANLFFAITFFVTALLNIFKRPDLIISIQFAKILLAMLVTILTFANIYRFGGLVSPDTIIVHNATDSLYFSIVTWTTLGYGDFHPTEAIRMYAALEALLGTIFLPLALSVLIYIFAKKKNS